MNYKNMHTKEKLVQKHFRPNKVCLSHKCNNTASSMVAFIRFYRRENINFLPVLVLYGCSLDFHLNYGFYRNPYVNREHINFLNPLNNIYIQRLFKLTECDGKETS